MSAFSRYLRFVTPVLSDGVVETVPSSTQTELCRASTSRVLFNASRWIARAWKSRSFAQRTRRLQITETVSLGEKRFVSIINVDGVSFLIGSSAHSVTLLAKLQGGEAQPLPSVLSNCSERQGLS